MPQVTTLKELCEEIYQTSTVGNINITAQKIKRSYKVGTDGQFEDRDFKRIGIAKQICLPINLIMS